MRTTLTHPRPVTVLAVGAALALTLTACGGNDSPSSAASPSSAGASAPAEAVSAVHDDADVTFLNDMAPHHTGAIAMAELAASQAGSTQVKDLAARITAAQGPEIDQMKAMAAAWEVTLDTDAGSMTGTHGGMSHTGGDDVEALGPLTGPAFDEEFLTRMTAHHMSAVMMAKTEIADGSNPQAKDLATAIVDTQEGEIAEMGGLLESL